MASNDKVYIKVIMLGDYGAGKTSLMERFIHNKYRKQYKATIGADFLTKEFRIDNQEIIAQIWDTAGAERYQSLGAAFYRGADAVVLIYDVSNQKSFEYIPNAKQRFELQMMGYDMNTFPMLLLANKCDLFGDKQWKEKCKWNFIADSEVLVYGYCRNVLVDIPMDIINLCYKYFGEIRSGGKYAQAFDNMIFHETSAKNGTNVHKAFEEIIRVACDRHKRITEPIYMSSLNNYQEKTDNSAPRNCCG